MKSVNLAIIMVLFTASLIFGQNTENNNVIKPIIGFNYGIFNSGIEHFDDVYDETDPVFNALLGVGVNDFYVIMKYRSFSATGQSVISVQENNESSDLKGIAEFSQDFIFIGGRYMTDEKESARLYVDAGLVYTNLEEKINTTNSSLSGLRGSTSESRYGFAVGAGLSVKVIEVLSFNLETEYSHISLNAKEGLAGSTVNAGGFFIGVGLTVMPF